MSTSPLNFNIITIFPDLVRANLNYGVIGQAAQKGLFTFTIVNPRDFTADLHKTVDDRPFGGGDGMLMLAEPLRKSVLSLPERGHTVYLSATGKAWTTDKAREWSKNHNNITLVCGRYGGIDQRFINEFVDEEVSVGDYVVSGGELPALMLLDSIVRFVPQVLGHADSAEKDSFSNHLLEAPLFTRPQSFMEQKVPKTFVQGDHKKIEELRLALSVVLTALKRPDLLSRAEGVDIQGSILSLEKLDQEELEVCGLDRRDLLRLKGHSL